MTKNNVAEENQALSPREAKEEKLAMLKEKGVTPYPTVAANVFMPHAIIITAVLSKKPFVNPNMPIWLSQTMLLS